MKKLVFLPLAAALLLSLSACRAKPPAPGGAGDVKLNFGVITGPTGIGAAPLMRDYGSTDGSTDYNITLAAAPTDLTALLINGELDIACLPTNVAATLYNKTNGGVQMLALNTRGVLYILENGNSVQSLSDLKGKTLYAFGEGQGANPEYILDYLLTRNGLTPGKDLTIVWEDSGALSAKMASGGVTLAMLPVPAATGVVLKNSGVRYALDLTAEWDKLDNGSGLYMGCVVVRTDFLRAHEAAAQLFMQRYTLSLNTMIAAASGVSSGSDVSYDFGQLLVDQRIVGSAQAGNAALPYAGLCNITGAAAMKDAISGYYQVLFDANPASIGGAIPSADFYSDLKF